MIDLKVFEEMTLGLSEQSEPLLKDYFRRAIQFIHELKDIRKWNEEYRQEIRKQREHISQLTDRLSAARRLK